MGHLASACFLKRRDKDQNSVSHFLQALLYGMLTHREQESPPWIAPKAVPDNASHVNFPQAPSIEYAEHADRRWACCKTQETQRNAAERRTNAEHANDQREMQNVGKVGFVRDDFG